MYDGLTFPVYRVCKLYIIIYTFCTFIWPYLISRIRPDFRYPAWYMTEKPVSVGHLVLYPVSGRIFDWISKYQVGYLTGYPSIRSDIILRIRPCRHIRSEVGYLFGSGLAQRPNIRHLCIRPSKNRGWCFRAELYTQPIPNCNFYVIFQAAVVKSLLRVLKSFGETEGYYIFSQLYIQVNFDVC